MYIQPISRAYNLQSSAGNNELRKKAQAASEYHWFDPTQALLTKLSEGSQQGNTLEKNFVKELKQKRIEQRLQEMHQELIEIQSDMNSTLNNISLVKPLFELALNSQSTKGNEPLHVPVQKNNSEEPVKEAANFGQVGAYQQLLGTRGNSTFSVAV